MNLTTITLFICCYLVMLIFNVVLIVFIFKKDKQYCLERTDLLNRVISKSTSEYITLNKHTTQPNVSSKSDIDILGNDYILNGKLN